MNKKSGASQHHRLFTQQYFCKLPKLKRGRLPKKLRIIGTGAFKYDVALTNIDLADNLCRINPDAFIGCPNIRSVSLPHSVDSIGENAFHKNTIFISVLRQFWCNIWRLNYLIF
ncbi:MAG: leucine-rich repeat domain-containing protein [Paludibacteraceae bacterium]|nr:leucine-rich repeat domain-containing protein [Paludibacteraceae bacterium]